MDQFEMIEYSVLQRMWKAMLLFDIVYMDYWTNGTQTSIWIPRSISVGDHIHFDYGEEMDFEKID